MGDKSQDRPADGERRAMIGYLPQYEVAAAIILRQLRDDTFEFVRIADPNAGRVDDVLVASTGRIDGHSVKWSAFPGTITFNDLVKNTPSWIAQLADGWERLSEDYPDRHASVHLVTCNFASTSDRCPSDENSGKSFAKFVAQVWQPFQDENVEPSDEWISTWNTLQDKSGLSPESFRKFARNCKFDFGTPLPSKRTIVDRADRLAIQQLHKLASKLNQLVVNPTRKIQYSRDELLRELDWTERYEFRNRHLFQIREPYEPIKETVDDLSNAIQNLDGGYITLVGSPGSGKSTLLSHTLEGLSDSLRLIKYYAYLPDATDPRSLRGEASHFLHDVVLTIERYGFGIGNSVRDIDDRPGLLDRFHHQLVLLGNDFRDSSRKTVILVDGLDHIPREQHPVCSLLTDLPAPSQLPEGVFIVLGTQTDTLAGLPPTVRSAMQQQDRRIAIHRMSRDASLRVVQRAKLPFQMSQDQVEKVVSLGAGHPLGLSLVLNQLKQLTSKNEIDETLEGSHELDSDIEEYYFAHWCAIESNIPMVKLMGYMARMRDRIDIPWIQTWYDRSHILEVRQKFRHLFRIGPRDQWRFFHNSFRQFLIKKTAQVLGNSPEEVEKELHSKLADVCSESDKPHSWDQIYHLAECGNSYAVVKHGSTDLFQTQMSDLRPFGSIQDDLRRVVHHAGQLEDVLAIGRTLILMAEMGQRNHHVDPWTIAEILFEIDRVGEGIEYLWNAEELRINEVDALKAARMLFGIEQHEEARRLFNACEPWNLLQPSNTSGQSRSRETGEAVQEWAKTVALFRPVDDIIRIALAYTPQSEQAAPERKQYWCARILFDAALTTLKRGMNEEFQQLAEALAKLEGENVERSLFLEIHRMRELAIHDTSALNTAVNSLVSSRGFQNADVNVRLVVAELFFQNLGREDETRQILKNIEVPSLKTDRMSGDIELTDCMPFFRFHRLVQALGQLEIPEHVSPDPDKDNDWPIVRLERSLILIAGIWADAWTRHQRSYDDVLADARRLISLLHPTRKELCENHAWYALSKIRKDVYQQFIDGCHQHGTNAVEAAKRALEDVWLRPAEDFTGWSSFLQREVALAVYGVSGDSDWLRVQLSSIEEFMTNDQDVSGRIEEYRDHANAYLALEDSDEVWRLLQKLITSSLGVGYRKDHQLENWIEWLNVLHDIDPNQANIAIPLFAAAVQQTKETTETWAARDASLALLKQAFHISPRRCVKLLWWLEKHGCVSHEDALALICQEAVRFDKRSVDIAWATTRELILTFAESSHDDLISELAKIIALKFSNTEACERFKAMGHMVRSRGLSVTRRENLIALEAVATEANLNTSDFGALTQPEIQDDQSSSSSSILGLKLSDGTELSDDEVKSEAQTAEGLLRLIQNTADDYHRWESLFENLLEHANVTVAQEVARSLPNDFRDSLSLAKLSIRLSRHGDRELGWQMAKRAMKCSSVYGWVKWEDGGTRLHACQALIAGNPTHGHKIALNSLARDLSVGEAFSVYIAPHLLELVQLCHPNPPLYELWQDVQRYVTRLAFPLPCLEEIKALWQQPIEDDTAERALCDILLYHHTELVPLLAQGAERALAQLIGIGNKNAIAVLQQELAGSDQMQTVGIGLIRALAAKDVETVRPFSEKLRELVQSSPNYLAWRGAQDTLVNIEETLIPPRRKLPLPGIYLLKLPPRFEHKPEFVNPEEPLPDAIGPRDMVSPYDFQLEIIAKLSQLDANQLYMRAAGFMNQLANAEDMTANTERKYRELLQNADLELPYLRPRVTIARQAMFRVLSELVDAGRIPLEAFNTIDRGVWCHDQTLALSEPDCRPRCVAPIKGLGTYGSGEAEWLETPVNSADSTIDGFGENLTVLAEVTELHNLGRSKPTEIRYATMVIPSETPNKKVFHHIHDVSAREYHDHMPHSDNLHCLIIRHNSREINSAGTDWIALNPTVCRSLGWSPSYDHLFAWVDCDGNMTAWTIWWQDGGLHFRPLNFEVEVGEGWLVVATKQAKEDITSHFGQLQKRIRIERSFTGQEERLRVYDTHIS